MVLPDTVGADGRPAPCSEAAGRAHPCPGGRGRGQRRRRSSPEAIDDIVRRLAEVGVEVVADEPTPEELAAEAVEEEPPSLDDAGPAASADLVRVYLREIGRVALLTAADEVDLAKRVEAGVFAAERLDQATGLPPALRRDLLRDRRATASAPSSA